MKTMRLFFWPVLVGTFVLPAAAADPGSPARTDAIVANATNATPAVITNIAADPNPNAPATNSPAAAPTPAEEAKVATAPPQAPPPAIEGLTNSTTLTDTNLLRLNFRGASLEMVLDYLSEAAGFIINLHASPRGRVDVWSNTPVTKEEALSLLDSVLRKNGYAAIRNGRTLTIVNRDEAKVYDIPVKLGSNPESIPRNDEIVTQIIPVRYVEVTQLTKDLQPLVSSQTTMTANEAGNSIVITDTQANIRRVAEIIQAIDNGAEDFTEVRVFRLQNSDPTEISDLLTSLFPDETRSGGSSQSPVQFGGFRRFFGGGPPGMASSTSTSGSQTQRIKKRARVLAVPDARTSSVVVSAAKDLMSQIEAVVQELDSSKARKQAVHVYQLKNADPEEVQQVLQEMFERNSTSGSRSQSQNTSTLSNRRTSQSSSTARSSSSQLQSGRTGTGR